VGQHAAIWLYAAMLTLQFAQEPLAQYTVTYAPDGKHFHAVTIARSFETRYQSPQLALWELGAEDWHLGCGCRNQRGGAQSRRRWFRRPCSSSSPGCRRAVGV